jgi:hypothetical protein
VHKNVTTMTKKEVLEKIRHAKTGHKRWMSYAKAIHMGIPVEKEAVPVIETDCDFGKWYYGEGQIFSKLDSFKAIEEPHSMLHQKYMEIYRVRKEPLKTGFFTSEKSARNKKQQQLDILMGHLVQIADMLMEALETFESDIENMSDAEVMRYFR